MKFARPTENHNHENNKTSRQIRIIRSVRSCIIHKENLQPKAKLTKYVRLLPSTYTLAKFNEIGQRELILSLSISRLISFKVSITPG